MNPYLVETLLAPFGAMSDEEIMDAQRINPNNAAEVKRLIQLVLKPEFDRYDEASQHLFRENLSYFLTAGFDHWSRLYEMSMPPIDTPDDPRDFFLWLWEVLFPDQDYEMQTTSDVKVVKDLDALKRLRVRA